MNVAKKILLERCLYELERFLKTDKGAALYGPSAIRMVSSGPKMGFETKEGQEEIHVVSRGKRFVVRITEKRFVDRR